MNPYAQWLGPESKWYEGLQNGTLRINEGANRVVDAVTNRFVGRLVPGGQLQHILSSLPLQPAAAQQAIAANAQLARLAPVLQSIQLLSGIGALASVANLGVSCVGFAIVLKRLSRIEGKLDECLSKLDVLHAGVQQLHAHQQALSLARLEAAAESLERALAATTATSRRELAGRARDLFQESKFLYRQLWRQVRPWNRREIPVPTALELQGRVIACAIGEVQAEFIAGDLGTFRQALKSAAVLVRDDLAVKPSVALIERSDGAARAGIEHLVAFSAEQAAIAGQLRLAANSTQFSIIRLESFEDDALLVEQRGIEPYELARAVQSATGPDLYLLSPPILAGSGSGHAVSGS